MRGPAAIVLTLGLIASSAQIEAAQNTRINEIQQHNIKLQWGGSSEPVTVKPTHPPMTKRPTPPPIQTKWYVIYNI